MILAACYSLKVCQRVGCQKEGKGPHFHSRHSALIKALPLLVGRRQGMETNVFVPLTLWVCFYNGCVLPRGRTGMEGHLDSCLLCQCLPQEPPPFSGSQSPNYTLKDSEERLCMCVEIYASAVPGSDISMANHSCPIILSLVMKKSYLYFY